MTTASSRIVAVTAAAACLVTGLAVGYLARPAQSNTDLRLIPVSGANATGRAVGEAAPSLGKVSADAMWWGGPGAILVPDASLPNTPGTADGYRFTADGVDRRAAARTLLQLFGGAGDVRAESGSFVADDTGDVYVWVSEDAMASFSASNNARSPWFCPVDGVTEPMPMPEPALDSDASGSTSGGGAQVSPGYPGPDTECQPVDGKLPGAAAAEDLVRDLMRALGVDAGKYRLVSTANDRAVSVQAYPIVQGQALGSGWYAEVGPDGLFSVNGYLAELTVMPGYTIVGARDAALRTGDARWSGFGPMLVSQPDRPQPVPMSRDAVTDVATSVAESPRAAERTKYVDGRAVITLPLQRVPVAKAERGMTMHYLGNGDAVVLPTWQYTDADGAVWSVIALDEKHVEFITR